ncbi:hypothetical protein ACNTMW_32685 [Planosporangium sp. 12N6]|uniref:hypothetical protein n=1 Tax=Planosporangium spinosum TaxID=3402278 RepID=UPI003CF772BB
MRMPLLLFVVLGRHIGADRLASMLLEQRRQQAELLVRCQNPGIVGYLQVYVRAEQGVPA